MDPVPTGETDLGRLLATLEPVAVAGEFVFVPLTALGMIVMAIWPRFSRRAVSMRCLSNRATANRARC